MKENIFIPKKCKVGFNERSDTYTGMLGYVIYHDGKKWRKEPSWESWRYNYIPEDEAERLKIEAYNRQTSSLFQRAIDNGGILKDHWVGRERVTIKDIKTEEDIMKVIKFEDFHHNLGKSSSNPKIEVVEFENEPLEGFVLNKKAGGGSSGWNSRRTVCRVYDPRGFEFEISIQNLLYILENTNSIKGKGLEGKFIYGWLGKDLILVPEDAPEFKEMMKFTKLQDGKVLKKDLVRGKIYMNSSGQKLTYLGEAYELDYSGYLRSKKKKLWFQIGDGSQYTAYQTYTSVQPLKGETGDLDQDFVGTMDKVEKHDKYYSGDIEYEKVKNPLEYLKSQFPPDQDQYRYNSTKGLFFKRTGDGELKEITIYKTTDYVGGYSFGNHQRETEEVYKIGTDGHRGDETFKELEHIINKYELWQLKMTK